MRKNGYPVGQEGGPNEDLRSGEKVPRVGLARVFLTGGVAAVGFFFYLALLPSDVEGRILGPYSASRLILMVGPILGAIVSIGLGVKTAKDKAWGDRLAFWIYGRRDTIPRILVISTTAALSLLAGVCLYFPQVLQGLNEFYVARLLPYFAWPVLMLALLSVPWLVLWSGIQWRITADVKDAVACGVLFLLSVGVRYPLTGYGLPYQAEWDEVITYTKALGMLSGQASLFGPVPGYGRASYGDLLIYTTALGEVAGLMNGLRTQQVGSVAEFVAPAQGIGSIYEGVHASGIPLLYPRILLVILNSLTPVLLYVALRKCLDQGLWASFAGGFIYAVISREVAFYSSYIMPDALGTTLSLAAFLPAIALIADKTRRMASYLACGIFAGLALSVSVRYASMVVVPLLTLALARDHSRLMPKLGLGLGGVLGGFLASSPRFLTNLPSYLDSMASLTWYGNPSVQNRLESLVYYVNSAFGSGSASTYVDSAIAGVGLGPLTLILAIIGFAALLAARPRLALLFLLFAVAHLYVVTSIKQNYSRHVLVLYPLACILAGIGLSKAAEAVDGLLRRRKEAIRVPSWLRRWRSFGRVEGGSGATLVFVAFLLLSVPQVSLTVQYARYRLQFKTTQVLVAQYLQATLQPGDKVGILDIVPWLEADLRARGVEFERIGLKVTLAELRRRGLTHVVGTDRIKDEYGSISGTIWDTAFDAQGARLAEFGNDWLRSRGFPLGRLYLFVARVPAENVNLGGD